MEWSIQDIDWLSLILILTSFLGRFLMLVVVIRFLLLDFIQSIVNIIICIHLSKNVDLLCLHSLQQLGPGISLSRFTKDTWKELVGRVLHQSTTHPTIDGQKYRLGYCGLSLSGYHSELNCWFFCPQSPCLKPSLVLVGWNILSTRWPTAWLHALSMHTSAVLCPKVKTTDPEIREFSEWMEWKPQLIHSMLKYLNCSKQWWIQIVMYRWID